jgi:N6-adenosine-specific RNA methylase IME4
MKLVRYDAALRALAEAERFDDVKKIRDVAVAMEAYAAQAKDTRLIADATRIRARAERRAGQLLDEMKRRGQRASSKDTLSRGSKRRPREVPKLADLGVSKTQSSRWQRLAAMDEATFEAKNARAVERAVAAVEGTGTLEKAARRAEREVKLAAKQRALPQRRYGVILADPEWRFEPWSRETGMDRAPENHYPTSVTEVIAARDVPSIAADDCALFLCATVPMLPQALLVMAAWGFDYVTHWVWLKDRIGLGYWNRNKHEVLLLGTRGNVPCPAPGEQWDSVIERPRTKHSEKPDAFAEMIEAYFPHLPKIELNRIGPPRPGWDAWGYEAEVAA